VVSVEEVKDAVKKELEGPGRLLGYRALNKKVRHCYLEQLLVDEWGLLIL